MAWYEVKKYERQIGGPSTGRLGDVEKFEATDEAAAKSEAYRRTRNLAPRSLAVLLDPDGAQLMTYEGPDA